MKFIFIFTCFIFMANAQLKYTEFKFGSYKPASAENGFYGGIAAGSLIDANIGYNFELGIYRKRFVDEVSTYDEATQETILTREFEQTSTMIPVLIKLTYIKEVFGNFLFKSDLGAGYAFLWNQEANYKLDVKDTRFYSDFVWQAGADLGLQISEKGSIFAGAFFNGANLTSETKKVNGLPTYSEKDMSGLGFRVTIRIDGFSLF